LLETLNGMLANERNVVTTTEDNVQVTEAAATDPTSNGTTENAEAPAAVKYPTFRELAFAAWKLTYRLAYKEDQFCVEGANEYLRAFHLPELTNVDGNEELMNSYLDAWYNFTHWHATALTEADDNYLRRQLARAITTRLRRNEPKSRATMNSWLEELGLELIPEPRHIGEYHVSHSANARVTSAMITQAFNAMFPEAQIEVSYNRRVQ
jgi:hypothetical protein